MAASSLLGILRPPDPDSVFDDMLRRTNNFKAACDASDKAYRDYWQFQRGPGYELSKLIYSKLIIPPKNPSPNIFALVDRANRLLDRINQLIRVSTLGNGPQIPRIEVDRKAAADELAKILTGLDGYLFGIEKWTDAQAAILQNPRDTRYRWTKIEYLGSNLTIRFEATGNGVLGRVLSNARVTRELNDFVLEFIRETFPRTALTSTPPGVPALARSKPIILETQPFAPTAVPANWKRDYSIVDEIPVQDIIQITHPNGVTIGGNKVHITGTVRIRRTSYVTNDLKSINPLVIP